MPTVGELFAGIGGLGLGLPDDTESGPFQAETEPYASSVLAKNFPGVPNLGDVKEINWDGVRRPDLVCGGFPCQPVSQAGRQLRQKDPRWLWPEFARCLRHLRPPYVLVENVPGLLGGGLDEVLGDLAALGYDAEWDCLPAAFFGAPHLRQRIFLVAYTDSSELRDEQGRGGPSGPTRLESARSAPPLTGHHGPPEPLANTDALGRGSRVGDLHAGQSDPQGRGARGDVADADRAGRPQRRISKPGGEELPTSECGREDGADAQGDTRRFGDGDGPNVEDPTGERGEWGRFNARSQDCGQAFGLPPGPDPGAGWWAVEPDVGRVANGVPHRVDRLRCLGNAVVPQVAEFVGHRILAHIAGAAVEALA